ncbi:MerR family transcriptional regulator [Bacteroidales bacterium AH-315-I05]|nr:MerR family transcriptional regulator [Bacteroidales bacterium AH-315-I05]
MLIGEISKKTSLSRDTIRFYEKMGLIKVERGDTLYNNYKDYTEETLRRLIIIKQIKGFGFTLNETAEILEMIGMGMATCIVVAEKVKEKIRSIDRKIKELEDVKKMIFDRMKEGQNNCNPKSENENCQTFLQE